MNVLEQDRKLAEKIWKFGCTCLDKARVEYINSRFDVAEQWAKEFIRCKSDLDELIKRKKVHDQLVEIAQMMEELGIDVINTAQKKSHSAK